MDVRHKGKREMLEFMIGHAGALAGKRSADGDGIPPPGFHILGENLEIAGTPSGPIGRPQTTIVYRQATTANRGRRGPKGSF